ncbi:uncharacterized protein LOC128238294 isoform X1 [Mya arenaria]|uniref:uncharacterized protein LOC128238294 isoform X1 n=1 Tax=Mya arenaria TaxID=6604 RepID=UPI0022E2D5CD|nr:uncharacterized protein LOC128238294 isoform X1 [Mya arenaria]
MVRTLKKQRPGCPLTLTIEKACRPSHKQQRGCKYKRGQWSECDGTTNIKTMVKTLKRGDPASCPPTQTKEKICKRKHAGLKDNCKYRKAGRWSTCDMKTGLISREMVLKKGDANVCLPSKTVTKSCSKKRGNRGKSGCKYDKSVWSPCDAATNKVTRTLTLVSGDPTLCNATKTQTKRCKDKHLRPHLCKYRRTSWGECDPGTNMREMVKTLKRGDPSKCEPTQTIERKCRSSRNTKVCKYKKEPWSACDPTTNLIMRRQVLQSGPATCRSVKEYTRKCKKECRFVSGEWSECDIESEQMTRVDNLRPGSLETCPSTRVLNKPCGRKEKRCVYGEADWLECDSSDQPVRTRTQPLLSGGPSCLPERVTTKSCKKKNGQERCFYGPWQAYDECQNGVRKKIRTVLQGGLECERKSVKMKAC